MKDIREPVRYSEEQSILHGGSRQRTRAILGVAMNGRDGMSGSQGGRFQWGSYGFLAGILLGVLMGWFFAGFIGAFIRVAMVALVIVPVVLVFLAWRKFVAPWLRPPAEPTTWGLPMRLRLARSFTELWRIRGRGDSGVARSPDRRRARRGYVPHRTPDWISSALAAQGLRSPF